MTILQVLSQIALIVTLFVVIVYTRETHFLRRLHTRPALVLTVDLSSSELHIRNVGSSAALNVEIPDFQGKGHMISGNPNWLDFLGVNEQLTIVVNSASSNKWAGMASEVIFDDSPIKILVRYKDIDWYSYETEAEVTSEGSKLVSSRRIGPWWK